MYFLIKYLINELVETKVITEALHISLGVANNNGNIYYYIN